MIATGLLLALLQACSALLKPSDCLYKCSHRVITPEPSLFQIHDLHLRLCRASHPSISFLAPVLFCFFLDRGDASAFLLLFIPPRPAFFSSRVSVFVQCELARPAPEHEWIVYFTQAPVVSNGTGSKWVNEAERRGSGLDFVPSVSPGGGLFLRRGSRDGLQVGSADRHTPEPGVTWGVGAVCRFPPWHNFFFFSCPHGYESR